VSCSHGVLEEEGVPGVEVEQPRLARPTSAGATEHSLNIELHDSIPFLTEATKSVPGSGMAHRDEFTCHAWAR
jgi:hypothetical protein